MIDPAVLSAIVIAAGSLAVSFVTSRQNRRGAAATNAVAARVVDREDFDAVMTRMENDLTRSDKRMTDLETRLEIEVTARAAAEERAIQAEDRALQAEARAQRLERRVTQLEAILRAEGMTIPPAEA